MDSEEDEEKREEKEKGKFFLGETMKVPIYNAIQAPRDHDHRGTPHAFYCRPEITIIIFVRLCFKFIYH